MKRISPNNLPFPAPLTLTAVTYLLLDKFQLAGAWWGVAFAIIGLLWIVWLVNLFTTEFIDIIKMIEK